MKRLAGKIALITGAASGIGLATAQRLAAEGAVVALADINLAQATAAAQSLEAAHGAKAHAFAFDAADEEQCTALVAETVAAFGGLDVLVNCAGIMEWSRAQDYESARWDRVLKINLYAVFYVSRAALPHLLAAEGNIVNISSAAGLQGMPYAAAYCASKSGVIGLTRSLAVEYADQGVRVNAICPGAVDTPMTRDAAPIPDWADLAKIYRMAPKTGKASAPEEIAATVAYLASNDACNVTGTVISVDGGQTAG